MDKNKNKNRSDLLAAGRKKLLQFRQKKDSNSGKTSYKAVKSEPEIGDKAASADARPTGDSVQFPPEGEVSSVHDSNLGAADSSVSRSMENSVATNIDAANLDPSLVPVVPEPATLAAASDELPPGISGSNEAGSVSFEGESANIGMPTKLVAVAVELEFLQREDQVADEADLSGLKQSDRSSRLELEGDCRQLGSSGLCESADTHLGRGSGETDTKATTLKAEQTSKVDDDVSASTSPINEIEVETDGNSVSPQPLLNSDGSPVTNQPIEDAVAASFSEEKSEVPSTSGDYGNYPAEATQADMQGKTVDTQGFLIYDIHGQNQPLETKMVALSSGTTVGSISYSQLAELLRGLDEDEFKFLLSSGEPSSNVESSLNNDCLGVRLYELSDLLERLQEQLYITNLEKDVFHLQLDEQLELQMEFKHQHHLLVDEISLAGVSLTESQSSENLYEELAQCRSELEAVVCAKEELLKQFHNAENDVKELSSRACELHIKLERAQGDSVSLSAEVAECRDVVATLQVENENLDGSLSAVAEEKKKLEEENGNFMVENEKLLSELAECRGSLMSLQVLNVDLKSSLALITEERLRLQEEKEYDTHENQKLLAELVDCKVLLEALQLENANLNGVLTSVTDERKKLEEEKEYFIHETKKLSMELDGRLTLAIAEKENLGEEKEHFISENKRLLMKLADCEDLMAAVRLEHSRTLDDLKEANLHLEQLTEDNLFLKSSLDMPKAKITEFDEGQSILSPQSEKAGNEVEGSDIPSSGQVSETNDESRQTPGKGENALLLPGLKKPLSDGLGVKSPLKQFEFHIYDDSYGFVVWKGHLVEAERILQKLEKEIEWIHFHSASLSKSSSKAVAPGVSKLIQAFESKSHTDDHELVEVPSTENRSLADQFVLAKEQIENLKAVLEVLGLDAENVGRLFKGERDGRMVADIRFRELNDTNESLKEHCDNLEAANIELVILYEIVKQHVCDTEANKVELCVAYEALWQQDVILKENSEVVKTLNANQLRVSEMQRRLDEINSSAGEMASSLHKEVEHLHKEVAERAYILEQEWNSTVAQVLQAIGKLDTSIGSLHSSALSTGTLDDPDIGSRVFSSVDAATKVIEDLQEKLKAGSIEHEAMCSSYTEMTEKSNVLHGKYELAASILHKFCGNIGKLLHDSRGFVEKSDINLQNEELLNVVNPINCDMLMEQLEKFLGEMMQLKSINSKLNSELREREKDIEELNKRCVDLDAIRKLVEDVKGVAKVEDTVIESDKPLTYLECLISFLLRKYKEADEQFTLSREKFGSMEIELSELKEQIDQLSFLIFQHQNEILILKESLSQAEGDILTVHSELQRKVAELEQSEQRVSSIREKLSIAVSKGKGLIVQRDGLKQSLAEMSSDLEKCSQELQLKEARLNEVEAQPKTYSEAGERVEALESELSYIRNSATALRESFLLKDSVLQSIEEILEDLELPEQFHSRDIIEKVDWLARSITGHSLPLTEWDKKSHSDSGLLVMDARKEDPQPNSNSDDDSRRKYEELQSKFYGLAEQNEMLEQSLMERNNLVQRWEDILDRINMPSQLQSMEPEDRIEWLGTALSESHHHCDSLQQKIDNFETFCASLTADLEASHRKISDLEEVFQAVTCEKENLSESLEILTRDHDKVSEKAVKFELEIEKLQNELHALQEKLVEKVGTEEHILFIEGEIRKLQNLVIEVLQDTGTGDEIFDGSSTECLELVRKLIEKCTTLSLRNRVVGDTVDDTKNADATHDAKRTRDFRDAEEQDAALLNKKLEDALRALICVKEERDQCIENNQSLVHQFEALEKKRAELQEQLSLEEQKLASVREKLNIAVRKGKSLVQQRDSFRQTIEEVNIEVEQLKHEISYREKTLSEYEQQIKYLTTYRERVVTLESETLSLKNCLVETEYSLQEKGHTLNMILKILGDIDVGIEFNVSDPILKLEQIGRLCHDLHAAAASSEHDSRKSKRAAELLLAELNEVQERNDSLQEELAKASSELLELAKERDLAEAANHEALSGFEKLSADRSKEISNQFTELTVLKSVLNQLTKSFSDINTFMDDVLSKDLEFLQSLEAGMKSCLKPSDSPYVVGLPLGRSAFGSTSSINSENKDKVLAPISLVDPQMQEHFDDNIVIEVGSLVRNHLQDFMIHIGALKEKLNTHGISSCEEAKHISELVGTVHKKVKSQKQSLESMNEKIIRLECTGKEKDTEIVVMCRNVSLLYEACTSSVMELGNWKAQLVGSGLADEDGRMQMKSPASVDGHLFPAAQTHFSYEECRTMSDRLLSVVKNSICMQAEIVEVGHKELKTIISNLQKELQDKDIQKERMCMVFLSQIKEAEAASRSYLLDLQSSKALVHDLERKVKVMEEEQNMLQKRVKGLEDGEVTMKHLHQREKSLTDVVAAKEQEIEALMQALDEEETQMEDLKKKIAELERVVQQKNLDLDNLEASHGKAMRKLSITVSKFDELHHLSAGLLSEIEKFQAQLQERDTEISFLRQEVTRCTNDALIASQISSKRNSVEIHDFLTWLNTMIAQVQVHDVQFDDKKSNQVQEFKEILVKQIVSIISELEDLREVAQSRDALLQAERSRVEELIQKKELLENSLCEKESRLIMLQGVGDSGQPTSTTPDIVEVEPLINKWAVPGTSIAPHVRSLRKVNNDQVAIAIDMDPGSGSRLEDEDDDKAHGFKSLSTSRVVPRFTRPVTDMIDGLWVSCDRALMRQPALRLGVVIYWAVMHALLATFVV